MADMPPCLAEIEQVLDGWVAGGLHHYPLKVQYEDTDLGGFVFHGQYVSFAERGRSAMLRCCEIDHNALLADNMAFTVRRVDIVFKAPSRQGEMLTVITGAKKIGRAVLRILQQICGAEGDMRAELDVEVAVIDLGKGAIRLPGFIHDRIVATMC